MANFDWNRLINNHQRRDTNIPTPPRLEHGPHQALKLEHRDRHVLSAIYQDSDQSGWIWCPRRRQWTCVGPITLEHFERSVANLYAVEQLTIEREFGEDPRAQMIEPTDPSMH